MLYNEYIKSKETTGMKKIFGLFLCFFLLLFTACSASDEQGSQSKSDAESQSESEFVSDSVNTPDEEIPTFYDDEYDLEIFVLDVHSETRGEYEGRVLFLSDAHFDSFSGVGGYTDAERQDIMVDRLITEFNTENSYDAVVFVGDTVSANEYLKKIVKETGNANFTDYEEIERVLHWKETYMARLEAAGIPCFYVNASHDALYGGNFESVFDYGSNYVILSGRTAYIVCDTYAGERKAPTYETTASDIPEDFYNECMRLLEHEYIKEAYMVSHNPSNGENLKVLTQHSKVRGTIAGHTHYNMVQSYWSKPLLQTGHFSRAYTKMITQGLGFKPFTPLNDAVVGTTTDEDGRENRKDYSASGSPWQWRVMETTEAGTESYLVFPEVEYKRFTTDGIWWDAFTQPYTEARPSFLGDDAPVDRSYKFFAKED